MGESRQEENGVPREDVPEGEVSSTGVSSYAEDFGELFAANVAELTAGRAGFSADFGPGVDLEVRGVSVEVKSSNPGAHSPGLASPSRVQFRRPVEAPHGRLCKCLDCVS